MRKALTVAIFFAFLAQGFAEESNPKAEITHEEGQSMEDLNQALTEVPYFENGQPAGYHQVQIQPDGTHENLSLKNSDVIHTQQ